MEDYQQALEAFNSVNNDRISRLAELAPKKQQLFFELLPLLFHSNAEILPDTFDPKTPTGIIGYQPEKTVLESAFRLNKKFQFKQASLREYAFTGIYLINDAGLLAYPDDPKFELWVILPSADKEDDEIALIESKLLSVANWANSLGIKLSSKIIFEDQAAQGSLDFYQHERFYVNSLVIAGASPIWWLIHPDEDYQTTAATLLAEPSLARTPLLNLGVSLKRQPEYLQSVAISALDSQLEKILEEIYQLQYIDYQVSNFTDFSPLSSVMKTRFYLDDFDVLDLDINVLKIRQLIAHPSNQEHLNLAIQSFYLTSKERLSQEVKTPAYPWRRQFMAEISQTWGWTDSYFKKIDSQIHSGYEQSQSELNQCIPLLLQLKNNINTFSNEHKLKQNELLVSVADHLADLTSTKPDDLIPQLPATLTKNNSEDFIHLYRFKDASTWYINNKPLSAQNQKSLYKHDSLLHVIAWAILNGVLKKASRVAMSDASNNMRLGSLQKLIAQLLDVRAITDFHNNHSHQTTPELTYIYLVVNLESQSLSQFDQQGIKLSSLQNDPLNHADRGESLISSIDGLILSSSGEWQSFQHEGLTSPLQMLSTMSHWWSSKLNHEIDVWCESDSVKKTISNRIKNLYLDVLSQYKKVTDAGNYVMKIGDFFYQLQWQPNGFDFNVLSKSKDLLSALNRPREHFSLTMLDGPLDRDGLITSLLSFQSPHSISCFIDEKTQSIYIIDELGLITKQSYPSLIASTLARHFQTFFDIRLKQLSNIALHFYNITKDTEWRATKINNPVVSKLGYLPVNVVIESLSSSSKCTIQCGPKSFSGKINDVNLFKQVADFTLNIRKANKNYPLYISELRFENTAVISTQDYLKTKQFLEKHLNTP